MGLTCKRSCSPHKNQNTFLVCEEKNISTAEDLTVTLFPDYLRSTTSAGLIHQGSDRRSRESFKFNMHHRKNRTTEGQGHVLHAQLFAHLDVQHVLAGGQLGCLTSISRRLLFLCSATSVTEGKDSFHICLPGFVLERFRDDSFDRTEMNKVRIEQI